MILSTELRVPMECVDALREPDCGVLEGRREKMLGRNMITGERAGPLAASRTADLRVVKHMQMYRDGW
jgi:hypothetical protein